MNWIFHTPARLRGTVAAMLLAPLLILAGINALSGGQDQAGQSQSPASARSAAPASTASTSPSSTASTGPAGASTVAALEAVSALLGGDRATFNSMSEPALTEALSQPLDGDVTGPARLLLTGPTQQKVSVPTSRGDMLLDMVLVDDKWTVADLELRP